MSASAKKDAPEDKGGDARMSELKKSKLLWHS